MDEVLARLREVLERHADVRVAYVFGSTARGTGGPLSDVDVAVLLTGDGELLHVRLALMADIVEALGSDRVDVVVLNEAPVPLAYRIIREGKLILSRDEGLRIRHRVRTVDRYLDMEPFRRVQEEGLRRRLREGRFGRP